MTRASACAVFSRRLMALLTVIALAAGCSNPARQPPAKVQVTTFRDEAGRATLALVTSPPAQRGGYLLDLPALGSIRGVLKLGSGRSWRVDVTASTTLFPAGGTAQRTVRLSIYGTIDPGTHQAHLLISVKQSATQARLDTVTYTPAAARAYARQVVAAFAANHLGRVLANLAPGLRSSGTGHALADQIRHVRVISAITTGPGRLIWLASGQPAWTQPVRIVSAQQGQESTSKRLVFVAEFDRWWLWFDSA